MREWVCPPSGGLTPEACDNGGMDNQPCVSTVVEYPLVCEDNFGTVETVCRSDGHSFVFELRGRTFRGRAFGCLWVDDSDMADLPPGSFPVRRYGPTSNSCDLAAKFTITLPLGIVGAKQPAGHLVLGFDYRDDDVVDGRLTIDGAVFTQTSCGWVEGNLIGLQLQLPPGMFLACCLSCRWSHFNPSGADDIGSLGCFVDWPDAATISNKPTVFRAWREAQEHDQFQYVQETWRCPRFRLIQPGELAYKDWDWFVHRKDGRVPPTS